MHRAVLKLHEIISSSHPLITFLAVQQTEVVYSFDVAHVIANIPLFVGQNVHPDVPIQNAIKHVDLHRTVHSVLLH